MYVAEEEEQGAEEVVARSISIFIVHLSVSIFFYFFVISFWLGPRYSLPYSASLKLEQTACQGEPKEQITDLNDDEVTIRVSLAGRL